ncbi:cytochrome P450 [Trametes sanguinea]|nr:cytochrome P450 [Trametes sanguinea]
MLSSIGLFILCGIVFYVLRKFHRYHNLKFPLPPGPRGFPLVGNIFDFPTSRYGEAFAAMTAKYGNVVHLTLFGKPVILLGSYDAAIDLLEKRSANYSDRPRSIMAELTGYDRWVFVLMQYGQQWRSHRRILAHTFHPDSLERAQPMLTSVARNFLKSVATSPTRFSEHIGFTFADAMMRVVYGIHLTDRTDRFFQMAETIVHVGSVMSTPGAFAVDTFPILRYVPPWFPGGHFKKLAAAWAVQTLSYRDELFEAGMASKDQYFSDSLIGTVMGSISDTTSSTRDLEEACRGAAATAYAGGADTTYTAVYTFFLAMAIHQDAQKQAQAELSAVVGSDRLPEFHDRSSLPFMNALIKEVLRWHVISPMGVPHQCVADDVYEGYRIPQGSLVIPNIWAMARDESAYPDADCFRPERFLRDGKINPDMRDPATFVFGFGRRICPGLHFVDMSLFITFASILHVFDIGPELDEHDEPVPVRMKFNETSLTARPEMFGCSIQPRSEQAALLVHSLCDEQGA